MKASSAWLLVLASFAIATTACRPPAKGEGPPQTAPPEKTAEPGTGETYWTPGRKRNARAMEMPQPDWRPPAAAGGSEDADTRAEPGNPPTSDLASPDAGTAESKESR